VWRQPLRDLLRITIRLACRVEGADGSPVDGDVIGVAVAAEGIKRHDDLGAHFPDRPDDLPG